MRIRTAVTVGDPLLSTENEYFCLYDSLWQFKLLTLCQLLTQVHLEQVCAVRSALVWLTAGSHRREEEECSFT